MEKIFDNNIVIPLNPDAATGRPSRLNMEGVTALKDSITIKWLYEIQLLDGTWSKKEDLLQKANADTRYLPATGELISMEELQERRIMEPAEYDANGNLTKEAVLADLEHQNEANFWWEQLSQLMQAIDRAGHQFAVRNGYIAPPTE